MADQGIAAVYGTKGRLRKKFVLSIKDVLVDLTSLAEELRQSFPLHADEGFGGISRMPAHLHLLYYQVGAKCSMSHLYFTDRCCRPSL
jgi:hypothetical protein